MKNILHIGFCFNDMCFPCNKMQTLREELEVVRSEKDQLSASMKDVIQGAESYKVGISSSYKRQLTVRKKYFVFESQLEYLLFTCTSVLGKRNVPVQLSTQTRNIRFL